MTEKSFSGFWLLASYIYSFTIVNVKRKLSLRGGTTKQSQTGIASLSLAMTFNVNLFNTFTIYHKIL